MTARSGLATRQFGGGGDPVVLVHGWAADASIWESTVARLGRSERFLCPDLPGHGKTPLRSRDSSSVREESIERLALWCDEHGVADAPMVGWAVATQLLVDLTARALVRPASLLLVALAGPSPLDAVPDPRSGPLWRDWPQYSRAIARMLTARPPSPDTESALWAMMMDTAPAAAGGFLAAPWKGPGPGFRLPRGSRAVLGARDAIGDVPGAEAAATLWGATSIVLAEAGHMPFVDSPVPFDEAMRAWLEETEQWR